MSTLYSYWTYAKFLLDRYGKSNVQLINNNSRTPLASVAAMYANNESIAHYMDYGYAEYESVVWVWTDIIGSPIVKKYHVTKNGIPVVKNNKYVYTKRYIYEHIVGAQAMWCICLHELGHVLAPCGSHHNATYQNILYSIIRENDYDEFLYVVGTKPVNQPAPIESELDKILLKYR